MEVEFAIPQEIAPKRLPQLPASTTTNSIVSTPINNSSFTPGSQILVDLVTGRGYLNPASFYYRAKIDVTKGAAVDAAICGIPAYSWMSSFQMLFNSNTVEQINDYGVLCSDLVNLKTNTAQKWGLASALGMSPVDVSGNNTFTSVNCYGRNLTTAGNASFYVSAPLPCMLSQCDSYVPLNLFGNVRIIITVDSLANFINIGSGAAPAPVSNFTISNFELCYDVVSFDPTIDQYYLSLNRNGKLALKTSSWMTARQQVQSTTSGNQSLPYNFRLASVKSLLLHNARVNAVSATCNGRFDSIDITSSNGQYSFNLSGNLYPPRPLDTLNNKAGIVSELCLSLYGNRNILSSDIGLTLDGFNATSTSPNSSNLQPACFFVGVNTERMPSNNVMLSGVSTLLAPIIANININTATSQVTNPILMAYYDAIMEIDVNTRDVKILQ